MAHVVQNTVELASLPDIGDSSTAIRALTLTARTEVPFRPALPSLLPHHLHRARNDSARAA